MRVTLFLYSLVFSMLSSAQDTIYATSCRCPNFKCPITVPKSPVLKSRITTQFDSTNIRVIDSKGVPVSNASVRYGSYDSFYNTLTNNEGWAVIKLTRHSPFGLSVTHITYIDYMAFLVRLPVEHRIVLKEKVLEIDTVSITSLTTTHKCFGPVCCLTRVPVEKHHQKAQRKELNSMRTRLYPQPVSRGQDLSIQLNEKDVVAISVQVFDMSGRIISNISNTTTNGHGVFTIPISSIYPPGSYTIIGFGHNGEIILRSLFIVQ